MPDQTSGRLPTAYLAAGTSSFTDFLGSAAPNLLPSARLRDLPTGSGMAPEAPHGTTIVALIFDGGVVMAGDRRATMGNVIASRDIQKVYPADESSVVGIAGSAGLAVELVRLYQVELEHYEKIEGATLSVEGKANRLATLLRGNLGLAFQGLAVVPIFAGYDAEEGRGRIFSYDVTGGRYEEHSFHGVGSGSMFARGSLKKLYHDGLTADEAVTVALEALYDAADDDSATGGPDLTRRLFPVVTVVDAEGVHMLDDQVLAAQVARVVDARMVRPDGPNAPLPTA